MATISLIRAKTNPGFPANTTAEFRFENDSMGTLTFPNVNEWKNFSPNSKSFSVAGHLELYMGNGVLVDTCNDDIDPVAQTKRQRTLTCAYGPYTVEFNVTVP